MFLEISLRHLAAVISPAGTIGCAASWFDHCGDDTELFAADPVHPLNIVARIGVKLGRWDRLARQRLLQQRLHLALVVVRSPVEHRSQRQQAGSEYRHQSFTHFLGSFLLRLTKWALAVLVSKISIAP